MSENTGLVGQAFHTFKPCVSGEHKIIDWQGEVVGRHGDYYLVETYDWLMGQPFCSLVVHISEMTDTDKWRFYREPELRNFYYEHRYRACSCAEVRIEERAM